MLFRSIGLFGTVVGITIAFQRIGSTGSTNLAVVGPSISEALIATAAGLFAAIPAVLAYNHFTTQVKGFASSHAYVFGNPAAMSDVVAVLRDRHDVGADRLHQPQPLEADVNLAQHVLRGAVRSVAALDLDDDLPRDAPRRDPASLRSSRA